MTVVLQATLGVDTAFADDNRFVFYEDIVKDKRTGLEWTRDANLGKGTTWNDAFELVKELNRKNYANQHDWRLPSPVELKTLVTYARGRGNAIYTLFNQMGFYDVQPDFYWTSSTCSSDSTSASATIYAMRDFDDDREGCHYKSFDGSVWPVRGKQR
ncbi:MAG: Lcl C-terminal domain-containing protein [Methylobacter sp.]